MKLCLYGAGNTGKVFLEKATRTYCGERYSEVFFTDSNKDLMRTTIDGYEVKDINVVDVNTEIIITSVFWHEIYYNCCQNNFEVVGIYDIEKNQVYTYKEMCMYKKCGFENASYIRCLKEKREKMDIGIKNFLLTGNLFENINEVAIMLSNLCNYAYIHKKCPANCVNQKEILPSEIVFKIFNELASINFDGIICFHIYNEPLIDPRLFWFIDYIKKSIPLSKLKIYSNGYYLNNQMVKELDNIGVDILEVTGYGEAEYNRMLELEVDMAYRVLFGDLDGRLDMYKERQAPVSIRSCSTYFTQVSIYSNGDIGTCCLDYRYMYGLANICQSTLKDSLNSKRIVRLQRELLSGNRTLFPICMNCDWNR